MKKNKQLSPFQYRHTVEHMIAPFVIDHRQAQYNNVWSRNDDNRNIGILTSITNQRMPLNSELRQQRRASFLSCGAFGQKLSFSFVSFLLDKQLSTASHEHLKKDINIANKRKERLREEENVQREFAP